MIPTFQLGQFGRSSAASGLAAIVHTGERGGAGATGQLNVPINPQFGDDLSIAVGDFLLLIVETANQSTFIIGTSPAGQTWTAITPVGVGTAAGTASTALYAFWKFAEAADTDGTSLVSVADSGNHQITNMFHFRNVDQTTPLDVTPVSDTEASATTTVTFPAITTVTDQCMVLLFVANVIDGSFSQQLSSASHAGLSSFSQEGWAQLDTGNGGGFSLAIGFKDTAGSTGTGSGTLANASEQARLVIALRPAST